MSANNRTAAAATAAASSGNRAATVADSTPTVNVARNEGDGGIDAAAAATAADNGNANEHEEEEEEEEDDEAEFVPDLAVDVEDARLDEEYVARSSLGRPKKKTKKAGSGSSIDDIFASLKAADAASTDSAMVRAEKKKKQKKKTSSSSSSSSSDGNSSKLKKKNKKRKASSSSSSISKNPRLAMLMGVGAGSSSSKSSSSSSSSRSKKKSKKNNTTPATGKADEKDGSSFWSKSARREELIAKARALQNANHKVVISKTVNYAGKATAVEKTVDANSEEARRARKAAARVRSHEDKLDEVLNGLNGPKSISTVEKSSYDWDKFKESNKLEEELAGASKDGYLGKKDFLHRVDERQFEKEKAERDVERSKRMANARK